MSDEIQEEVIPVQNPEVAVDPNAKYMAANTVQAEEEEVTEEEKLRFLHDVPLHISVELGRNDIILKDLMQMQDGTVIELEKLAGEALEVLLNGRIIARGEVVVVNEKYGIRLTDNVNSLADSGPIVR